jgi:hypothetical protein
VRTLFLIAILLGALVIIHVYDGTALLNTPYYLIDFWFVGDAAWRTYLGQVPHLDFHTPVGQAYFWPYALTSAVIGPTTEAVLLASALVGAAAGILSWALLRHGAPAWAVVGAALLAFGCAVTPRWMDVFWPSLFSHLAPRPMSEEDRIDADLRRAGILPGDPSLYPEKGDISEEGLS